MCVSTAHLQLKKFRENQDLLIQKQNGGNRGDVKLENQQGAGLEGVLSQFDSMALDLYVRMVELGCIIIMEYSSKIHQSSIRYAKISLKKRMQLVKQVVENQQLVSKAAKRLNLKLSTAKLIVKRFREDGTFFEAKAEKLKRAEKEPLNHGKRQNITNTAIPQQNFPKNQEKAQQIEPNAISYPSVVYFQHYCGTPYTYGLPFFQNLIFYPY